MATVEAAFAIAAVVTVALLCLAGIGATVVQIRCVDAAREAARLAARADPQATTAAAQIAPDGARIGLDRDGDTVRAVVTATVPMLPMITLTGRASATVEPDAEGAAPTLGSAAP